VLHFTTPLSFSRCSLSSSIAALDFFRFDVPPRVWSILHCEVINGIVIVSQCLDAELTRLSNQLEKKRAKTEALPAAGDGDENSASWNLVSVTLLFDLLRNRSAHFLRSVLNTAPIFAEASLAHFANIVLRLKCSGTAANNCLLQPTPTCW